jgi:hypothetical protein
LLRQRKVPKRKATLQSATPSRCYGANLRRGVCGVRRGTHFAAAQLRSDKHGESDNEACARRRACHPANAPPQAQPEGGGQPKSRTAKQPHGPSLRSAHTARAQAPRAAQTGPSAAMARMDVRLRVPFRMRRGAQRPADQGSRLFERSEFERDPAGREHRRLPAAKRRDAACRVAFSLVTFSWRGKRKLLRRRAHTPAPTQQRHLKAIKTIANSACCISATKITQKFAPTTSQN